LGTGSVGTLKTLVDYPYPSVSSTRKAVSIGGGAVSLPSSFTLAISPTNPSAGTPLTITATAQTIAGVPQAGVTVSMTVSSGPDAGQTFTATTDASGIATITVNTSSTGTNVYTATATVNGVSKTVSATVAWSPAPTTTTELTTTIVAQTSTTSSSSTTTSQPPAPVTTVQAIPAVTSTELATTTTETKVPDLGISSSTQTTVHDHSSHSHGSTLPSTGSNTGDLVFYGFILSIAGFIVSLRFGGNKK